LSKALLVLLERLFYIPGHLVISLCIRISGVDSSKVIFFDLVNQLSVCYLILSFSFDWCFCFSKGKFLSFVKKIVSGLVVK